MNSYFNSFLKSTSHVERRLCETVFNIDVSSANYFKEQSSSQKDLHITFNKLLQDNKISHSKEEACQKGESEQEKQQLSNLADTKESFAENTKLALCFDLIKVKKRSGIRI